MSIRQRALIGGAASVLVVGTSVGLYAAQSPGEGATELQVEDTADVIYAPDLEAALEERVRRPVRLGPAQALNASAGACGARRAWTGPAPGHPDHSWARPRPLASPSVASRR